VRGGGGRGVLCELIPAEMQVFFFFFALWNDTRGLVRNLSLSPDLDHRYHSAGPCGDES
jgi:hypothetical protein